jgi:hypothetical protein
MLGRLHEDGNVGSFVQASYPGAGCQIDPQLELVTALFSELAILVVEVVVRVVPAADAVAVVVVVVTSSGLTTHTSSKLQDCVNWVSQGINMRCSKFVHVH